MRRRDKWLFAGALLVFLIVAVRVALPSVLRDYVNGRLQALEGYEGHIEDIDLSLLRGAYRIENIQIVRTPSDTRTGDAPADTKTDAKAASAAPVPFFSCPRVEFSVEWPSLIRGSLVAEGEFHSPNINFVQGETSEQSQTGEGVDWGQRLAELFPFRFNTVRVHDGTITFLAPGIQAADAMKATRVEGEVTNLTNVAGVDKETFANFRLDGEVLDGGAANISGSVDPLAAQPTFDVNLQLRNVKLPQVNPWLRQYIKADAEAGDFELYLEIAAADGRFQGYAKPVLQNVDIYSSEEPEQNFFKRMWEGLVDFAANVLENEEQQQVAARIPFTGTIEDPESSVLQTIVSVLHNAFVGAFARSLEGSVSVRNVRKNLEGIGEPAADDGSNGKEKKKQAGRNEQQQEEPASDNKRPRGQSGGPRGNR
jgi:hypothetical protein